MILLFDCDGTLVDTEILHAEIEGEIYRDKFGFQIDVIEHSKRFCGSSQKIITEWLEKEMKIELPPGFEREVSERKMEAFRSRVKATPFMTETLEKLGAFRKAVASNTPTQPLFTALQSAGLAGYFAPNIFSAEMVAQGKPAPDLYLFAARMMGVEPKDCLVIEDSVNGITAARAAHMRVLGFAGGGHCYPEYAEKLHEAELVFTDMRQLPQLLAERLAA